MMFPAIGTPLSTVALDAQSPDILDCDFRNLEPDPDTGLIVLPSGQSGTWSRAATLASVSDANGATYTALDGQIAYEQRDWDNDSVRESFGVRMGTSDRLAFPASVRSNVAISGLIEFIETGAVIGTAGGTLLALTKDDGTGDGWYIDTTGGAGGFYRFNLRVGGTTRQATLAARPVTNDRVQLFWDLTQPGVPTVYQSINAAAATSATAAALAQPSAWGAPFSIRVNSRGTSVNPASAWYRRIRIVYGALNQTTIQERR